MGLRIRLILVFLSTVIFISVIAWRGMKLGLDLKGGSYFILNVRKDLAVQKYVERLAGEILSIYKEKYSDRSIQVESPVVFVDSSIYVVEDAPEDFVKEVQKKFPVDYKGKDLLGGVNYHHFEVRKEDIREVGEFAVSQAIQVLRNRIDEFGVAEPLIARQGESQIMVQLPGLLDPAKAKSLIGRTALLEFRLVDEEFDYLSQVRLPPEGIYKGTEAGAGGKSITYYWTYDKDYEKLANFVQSISLPAGRTILIGRIGRENTWRTFIVESIPQLTGEFLKDARVRMNPTTNEPYVIIRFDSTGAEIFERITSENVGKKLAIVLDGKIFSAPVIREKISGGVGSIEGRFTIDEARELAAILRAGALPAPMDFEEERTIGPTLGEDSIKKGIVASVLGATLVAVFMSFYYRISGVLAVFGVVVTLLFTLAVLSIFGATLTLPGIAGIALTAGMAVDNNIIIFERIREELIKRLSLKPAIEIGHKLGMRTVLDANITTLIAALFIFQFGTGPIRGFALTLSIGILGAIFGSVYSSKVLMEWLLLPKRELKNVI